jgi:hypothetical protein
VTDRAALAALTEEIVACRRCPRLVEWRERVAREKVARFRDETFGHAVALNHSSASADVMWQYINAGQVKRTLTAHDKDGISWFYPVH